MLSRVYYFTYLVWRGPPIFFTLPLYFVGSLFTTARSGVREGGKKIVLLFFPPPPFFFFLIFLFI